MRGHRLLGMGSGEGPQGQALDDDAKAHEHVQPTRPNQQGLQGSHSQLSRPPMATFPRCEWLMLVV